MHFRGPLAIACRRPGDHDGARRMALFRVKHYPCSVHSVDHEGILTLPLDPREKVLLLNLPRPTHTKFLFELERDALGHLDDAMAPINGSSVCRASL